MRVGWLVVVSGCASGASLRPAPVFGPFRPDLGGCTWTQAEPGNFVETRWDRAGRPLSERRDWSVVSRRTVVETTWTWRDRCPVQTHVESTLGIGPAPTGVTDEVTICDDHDQPVRRDSHFQELGRDARDEATTWTNTYDGDDLVRVVGDIGLTEYRWDHHRLVEVVTSGPDPWSGGDLVTDWTADWGASGVLLETRTSRSGGASLPEAERTKERYDEDGYWLGTDRWAGDLLTEQQRWWYGPGDGFPSRTTTTGRDGEVLDDEVVTIDCG